MLDAASPALLEAAVAWNHHEWLSLEARAMGGEVRQADGVTWTYAERLGEGMILFPRLTEAVAGTRLDALVQYYRERRPHNLVGCWSLDPPQPLDLGVRLLARGFQPGWQPRWMWLDLPALRADQEAPPGLAVDVVEDARDWDVEGLPYFNRESAAIAYAAARLAPRQGWHFGAWLEGKVVAHGTLCVTSGPLGVAGLYGIGVVPEARGQGVGKAVTLAACRHALSMGCRYVLLNGTGERMYRQMGFERLGFGQTWWLNVPRLEANPPTASQVAVAEAVGRGDLAALSALGAKLSAADLDVTLANEMTLVELAAHERQPASAEWLAARGATIDVLSAWDLGWKDRVPRLLTERPELASRRVGELGATPLHQAAQRNDVELARVLLEAGPDLGLRDTRFHATALDWARHQRAVGVVELLERHRAG